MLLQRFLLLFHLVDLGLEHAVFVFSFANSFLNLSLLPKLSLVDLLLHLCLPHLNIFLHLLVMLDLPLQHEILLKALLEFIFALLECTFPDGLRHGNQLPCDTHH